MYITIRSFKTSCQHIISATITYLQIGGYRQVRVQDVNNRIAYLFSFCFPVVLPTQPYTVLDWIIYTRVVPFPLNLVKYFLLQYIFMHQQKLNLKTFSPISWPQFAYLRILADVKLFSVNLSSIRGNQKKLLSPDYIATHPLLNFQLIICQSIGASKRIVMKDDPSSWMVFGNHLENLCNILN